MGGGSCPQRICDWLQPERKAVTYLGSYAEPTIENCNTDCGASRYCNGNTDCNSYSNSAADSYANAFRHADPFGGCCERAINLAGRI